MGLWSEFLTNEGRLIHKWTHYFPIYERHFAPFVNRSITLFEIGVYKGGSVQLWKRHLGPYAQIVGIDINPECAVAEDDQIAVRIGDQADTTFLQSIVDEFGAPDIVIDDGSHMQSHVVKSFRFLYPKMTRAGLYLVEDLHTAYWDEFGGGVGRPGTFVEVAKGLIDELNADHTRGAIAPNDFSRTTLSMHFYDSVIVLERGRHLKKHAPMIGKA